MPDTPVHVLEDDPPGALLVIACLLGQHDGRTFIPDTAFAAMERTEVRIWRDIQRDGWQVEVRRA